jgi:ribokinase
LPLLRVAAQPLDALVGSAHDPAERYTPGDLDPTPFLVVRTEGAAGGYYTLDGATHRFTAPPATVTGDTYGAGDTFAAGLTLALGEGMSPDAAIAAASRRAVEVLRFVGPYSPV